MDWCKSLEEGSADLEIGDTAGLETCAAMAERVCCMACILTWVFGGPAGLGLRMGHQRTPEDMGGHQRTFL